MNRQPATAAPPGPPAYEMIEATAALKGFMDRLAACPVVALDTEANSLHHYRECVSLIQVTGREADGTLHHAIIDPLADVEVGLLAPVLADPAITCVFHGADYDVVSLKRDYGFAIRGIYDTMIAARAAGVPRFGLADLVRTHFDVTLNKKYQKHDWASRPLSREALDYAHLDTRYLPEIMDRLKVQVTERGRDDMVAEECALVEQREWVRKEPDPNAYLQLKGAPRLGERDQKVLRELFDLREELARKRDWPPFKIMGTETLLTLATGAPTDAKTLEDLLGRHNRIVRRYGPRILDAIATGLVSTRELPPRKKGEGRRVTREDEVLLRQLKDWRNALAESEGIEPSMVVNNQVLQEVSSLRPRDRAGLEKVSCIRQWQLRRYADALLEAVERFEAGGGGRKGG